jgi:hypothetical protein
MHRRLLFSVLSGLALLVSMVLTPAAAQAADFPFTTIRTNAIGLDRCFGPLNGNTADGTPVVLMNCNQLWHGTGNGGAFENSIRHFSGKCLSLANGSTANGTPLVLRDCSSIVLGDQQWTFAAVNPGGLDGVWVLRNRASFKCANLANGGTAIGTPLVLQFCSVGLNQQWLLPNPPNTYGFPYDDGTTV